MSSKHNRRKRKNQLRGTDEMPVLVERIQQDRESYNNSGETWKGRQRTGNYELDNWPWLSPKFRDAHNRRLQARGLPTIPPPAVDLYVAPQAPRIMPVSEADMKEQIAAARQYMGGTMIPGSEGFTINKEPQR